MVQFPRYRLTTPPGRDVERLTALRVTPFGHPRISGCLLLLVAYRSLPRPSSPSSSKASAVDPCPLAISPISPSLCPMPPEKDPVRSVAASEARRREARAPMSKTRRHKGVSETPLHACIISAQFGRLRRDAWPGTRSVWRAAGIGALRIGDCGGMGTRTPDLWLAKPSL